MELLRYATQVTELLREAGETLAAMRGLKRGVLKLGAVSTAKYFAPTLLSAFTPAYPEVAIKFTVGNREEIVKLLGANELDLVIMGRPPRELDTTAEPFARHPLVIIASPDHPLARRHRIPLKSLARESFIIREQGSGTRASMEHVFRERGVTFRASMEVSSNETIKQAVMAGMGLSFISSHTIGLEAEAGKLAILDVVGLPDRARLVCDSPAREDPLADRLGVSRLPAGKRRACHPGDRRRRYEVSPALRERARDRL